MEAGSEGDSNKNNNNNSSREGGDGSKKPKRQMKTPFQLDTLEKIYAAEMYPSEATRAELSEKLGLSDRQLQMWFCHRRLKDKKEGGTVKEGKSASKEVLIGKKQVVSAPVERKGLFGSSRNEVKVEEQGSEGGSGSMSRSRSGSGSGPESDSSQFDDDVPVLRRCYELSPRTAMERRVVSCVEMQLGGPLREDGPILGMEFDELPPGAFGEPMAVMTERWGRSGNSCDGTVVERSKPKKVKGAVRSLCEPSEPSSRADAYRSPSQFYHVPADGTSMIRSPFLQGIGQQSWEYGAPLQISGVSSLSHQVKQEQFSLSHQVKQEKYTSPAKDNDSTPNAGDVFLVGRKRKNDEGQGGRDVIHEKRIRKELEKQDILRRKMRKELEKQDRERRKEEERMLREQQRREEKYQREEKREIERREKFMQRELVKAERMKQKEELRREREAARQKVAMEKAALRKVAKESLELIEDERLELMELAACSKGLSSIIFLDYETLQNIDSFRDSLCAFPPNTVQMKRPFSIQPWMDSDDNIGKILMVWKFCITFSDVLGLWPFTLDEFLQAFHDHDSRLLAEIHIALLKLIIRDIAEGARTPCGGAGTNQYTVANPEGGHPHIVEGAFLWGFDIRSWQNHLNPLTWPEIFRQFALSAGFGPQLKKDRKERAHVCDNNEVKGCEDIVSMLRNGSAVENAVAVMQEKGSSLQRRSRHRLTPGTVKFAAYHVLCLEGSKGQTVLELADKIQKSGLRDLSTSRTPDASISVALSRDPILFERIAPSTYCVRPSFRKDPANAEVILAAAREKIQKYANGFLADETPDDIEKDEESESDVAEGPEIDELGTSSDVNKTADHYNELGILSGNANDIASDGVTLNLQSDLDKVAASPLQGANQIILTGKDVNTTDFVQGVTEVDESKSGEPWVQGLTEGEYCDLCVEERLNALVAIVGVANEGNIIRAVLEDRLDAVNALKKQMWAEAQLDKRRLKEEGPIKVHDSSLTAAADGNHSPFAVVENQNEEPSVNAVVKEETAYDPDNVQNNQNHSSVMNSERSSVVHDTSTSQFNPLIQHNGSTSERSRLQLKSFIGHRAEEIYVYRSLPLGQDRRHNRYWQFVASASEHDPGSGRIFVELCDGHWRLIDSEEAFDALLMSLDTRGIRESHLHIMLQQCETSFKENVKRKLQTFDVVGEMGNCSGNKPTEIDSSIGSLAGNKNPSSAVSASNSLTQEPSLSFSIDLWNNETERMNAFKRYQEFQEWMWKECCNSSTLCAMKSGRKGFKPLLGICESCLDSFIFEENSCPSCHGMFGASGNILNYLESVNRYEEERKLNPDNPVLDSFIPLQIRLIKALMSLIEVSVSSEALQSFWTGSNRRSWGLKLQSASAIGDLLQILTQFEGVIKRDWLSMNFETTTELLGSCSLSGKSITESDHFESVPVLPWIPQTTAAVALRLLELDSSLYYSPCQKDEASNGTEKLQLQSIDVKDRKVEPTELPQDLLKPRNLSALGSTARGSSSKHVIRSRGGARPRKKSQKKVLASRSKSGKRSIKINKTGGVLMKQQEGTYGQARQVRGMYEQGEVHVRGPRTVRRRRESKGVEGMSHGSIGEHGRLGIRESAQTFDEEEWVGEETGKRKDEDAYNNNSTESSESDDDADPSRYGVRNNAHSSMYGDHTWEPDFNVAPHKSAWDAMDTSDEDVDGIEMNVYEDDDNLEEDVDMNDGVIGNNGESSETSGDFSD